MNKIWAPWRIEYLREKPSEDCFLCGGLTQDPSPETLFLKRDEHASVVLNRYPYTAGHLLVAPNRHVASFNEMTEAEERNIFRLLRRSQEILATVTKADGFNIGVNLGKAAGAALEEHIHWHIVPRWHGDTNCMPVLADVKVIPQALDQLWHELAPYFEK